MREGQGYEGRTGVGEGEGGTGVWGRDRGVREGQGCEGRTGFGEGQGCEGGTGVWGRDRGVGGTGM